MDDTERKKDSGNPITERIDEITWKSEGGSRRQNGLKRERKNDS